MSRCQASGSWRHWPLASRRRLFVFCVCALSLICGQAFSEVISVWFAPDDDCEAAIVGQFQQAQKSIHYQMYNFTSEPIAAALCDAAQRGVEVIVLLDRNAAHQPKCQAVRAERGGCKVFVDARHPISHNKIRIIDGRLTLGGSYNDSAQAKRNAENLTLDDSKELAAQFEANFQKHLEHGITLKRLKQLDAAK